MSEHNRLVLFGFLVLLLFGVSVHGATVHFVSGEVVEPEGLNEGENLRAGERVRTGADGVVMIEYRWTSDEEGFECQHLEIFGYGASHTVREIETRGQCTTRVAASVPDDGAFSTAATRYGDAPHDGFTPDNVQNSWAQTRGLDIWLQNAERSYTGKVESISKQQIKVKGARSAGVRRFSLTAAALSGHADRNALIGRNVRVTYKITFKGPEAIRVDAPGGAVIAQPFVVLQPDLQVVRPDEEVKPVPDPKPTPKPQTWRCRVDLHQGDVGTMELRRAGVKIRGAMYIERIDDKHPISGTWKGDRIEFRRKLSASSGQPFKGTATKTSDKTVAMAGRFAHQYAGVWSADCTRVGSGAGAAVGAAGRYELVLTGYEGDKIAAIKSVREVTGMGLKASKDAVEQPPSTLRSNLSKQRASHFAEILRAVGVKVRIQTQ
ncbi:MAG: ribosomal protein L7/L12 [Candidatus Thiodiazotropha sp.]